ncbi:MAG: TlpA family protein disulfide reductase [Clostridiales bacterium]|nr:TlpA family protein disulfide reductase [Clostridiales bacterium]
MTKIMKTVLWIAGFVILMATAVFAYNALSDQVKPNIVIELTPEPEQGGNTTEDTDREKAPDFTMLDINGNTVKLSDMVGKPIVLNFWASWCPPCKAEMPDFEKVFGELGDEVQFIMLNLTDGQRETIENGKAFIGDAGYTFPIFFDSMQEGAYIYGIRSIPTTIFIDKDGYIIASAQGAIDEATLRRGIELAWGE